MKNLVIPFFDAADLAALPVVLDNLSVLQPERVLVIVNPSIGVDSSNVSAKFDNQIADIKASMKQAVDREDFVAANSYKEELQGAQVQRDLALREGYKHLNPEQLMESWKNALKALDENGAPIIGFREVFQKTDFPNALQSVQKYWPAEIPHGEYAVVWPLSLSPVQKSTGLPVASEEKTQEMMDTLEKMPKFVNAEDMRKQLSEMDGRQVLKMARDMGIHHSSMKAAEAIDAIVNKEFPVAA